MATPGRRHQALLVIAHLRKGETYTDLASGFGVGTTTVFRYIREALDVLAALAPTLAEAIAVALGKAFVILDGTLLSIDRVGMVGGRDRPYYSGKHKRHGVNVQVLADPVGRLIWASPALPGARHDMGAAREHGILDALNAAGVRVLADNGYHGAGPQVRVPQRRRRLDPTPAAIGACRATRSRSTLPTPANADPVSGRTPSSRAGASSARSAAAHAALPAWSKPSWSSSWLAEAKWKEFTTSFFGEWAGAKPLPRESAALSAPRRPA